MRDVFPGYYKPTDAELKDLWANALVVLDTNALFNLFRYTNSTRTAFLSVLAAKKERLWLPYQVGFEFQEGRLGIIEDQNKAFTDLIEKTKTALSTVTKDVNTLRNHPTLDLDELRKAVDDAISSIEGKIESTRKKYQAEVLDSSRHDATTDLITDLYDGRVGQPYTEERLKEVYDEGATRYEHKVPPGYKDVSKPVPNRYGDLVLWMQLLDKGAADDTTVIFVSDDQKEDWWREFKGRKIGPRVELIDEFRQRVGKRIYFLTPQALMTLAKAHDPEITADNVTEVAEVSEARAQHDARLAALENQKTRAARLAPDDSLQASDLRARRSKLERELRNSIRRSDELASLGLEDSPEYADIQHKITYLGERVDRASRLIKDGEFAPYTGLGERGKTDLNVEMLSRLRDELIERGYPPVGTMTSWREIPITLLSKLVRNADLLGPEFINIVDSVRTALAEDPHGSWG